MLLGSLADTANLQVSVKGLSLVRFLALPGRVVSMLILAVFVRFGARSELSRPLPKLAGPQNSEFFLAIEHHLRSSPMV